ncbi:hypothetical protein ACWGIU_14050 [Streptomyces sp. NPDC054840]
MSSDLLDPRLELMAMPPQEEALREVERRDAASCIARHARDEKDRALLLAALGLADPDYADSLDDGLTETYAEFEGKTGGHL